MRDLGEHALKDLHPSPRGFSRSSLLNLVAEFPPLRTAEQLLRNVPRPATALIGREEQIAAIRALLGLLRPQMAPSRQRDC